MSLALLDLVRGFSWTAVWFWLLCLIGLVWLRRHLDLNRAGRHPILSPADAGGEAGPLPRLTVLVAAKDEQANIGTCLSGVLAQHYADLEVVAINDRSADRTGEIIAEFAARDARVKPVHVDTLPAGWTGKNHAMHQGVRQATGEYVCFTDADCQFHAPELLAAAVRVAQRQRLDFLSVLPELEAHTFWERVVQPPAGAVLVFWFPPEKVNDPHSTRAYANGAFMLMSRECYDGLGGHEQAKAAIGEDMQFARRAKRLGRRLFVIRGGGMYSVRMYVGLRAIWNGWTRIFYCCFGSFPRLLLSVAFLSIFSLLPYVSLLLSPFGGPVGTGIAAAAAGAIVVQQTVLWRFYALGGMPRPWALTYPLGAALCLGMTINAMSRLAGLSIHWRGTTYRHRA